MQTAKQLTCSMRTIDKTKYVPRIFFLFAIALQFVAVRSTFAQNVEREPSNLIRSFSKPIYSSDNSYVIFSPVTLNDYRYPILKFVDDFSRNTKTLLQLAGNTSKTATIIELFDGTNEKAGAINKIVIDGIKRERESIVIFNPETVELDALRAALVKAILRNYMREKFRDSTIFVDPPAWFITGVVYASQRDLRQKCFDRTFQLWSSARLPIVVDLLCDNLDGMEARDPAVSAQLVTWLLDQEPGKLRLESLLERLAAGSNWDKNWIMQALWPEADFLTIDDNWDRWLYMRTHTIFLLGSYSPGITKRFMGQFMIFPADHHLPMVCGWLARNPDVFLHYGKPDLMKRVALEKGAIIRAAAMGRPAEFQQAAELFTTYLTFLSNKKSLAKAGKALDDTKKILCTINEKSRTMTVPFDLGNQAP